MRINGQTTVPGNFHLFKVGQQANGGPDLHSVYFVADSGEYDTGKVYEVVFAKTGENGSVSAWYFVEKPQLTEIPEAEIVNDPTTLSIGVTDELKLGEILN